MGDIWAIARNDIRKMVRSRTTYLYALIMILASSSYFLAYHKIISGLMDEGASARAIHDTTRSYLNTTLYVWPLMYCLASILGVGSVTLTLEKTARNLEPLMATPLSVQQIWVGKSLGVSVVGVVVGLTDALIVFLGATIILVIPKTGGFVAPDAVAIATALVVVPVLVFMVVLLTSYMQLIITNPRAANGAFAVVLIGVWIGLAVASYYVQSFNYYTPIYLGLIVTIGVACRSISRWLTPERVVLSSKG
jgi:ABC-type Na+ efflux pump permease subunit